MNLNILFEILKYMDTDDVINFVNGIVNKVDMEIIYQKLSEYKYNQERKNDYWNELDDNISDIPLKLKLQQGHNWRQVYTIGLYRTVSELQDLYVYMVMKFKYVKFNHTINPPQYWFVQNLKFEQYDSTMVFKITHLLDFYKLDTHSILFDQVYPIILSFNKIFEIYGYILLTQLLNILENTILEYVQNNIHNEYIFIKTNLCQ